MVFRSHPARDAGSGLTGARLAPVPASCSVEEGAGYRVELLPWAEHVELGEARPAYRRHPPTAPGPFRRRPAMRGLP